MARPPSDPNAPRLNKQARNIARMAKARIPMLMEAVATADVDAVRGHATALASDYAALARVVALAQPPTAAAPVKPAAPTKK
jgi:hypothetical protein